MHDFPMKMKRKFMKSIEFRSVSPWKQILSEREFQSAETTWKHMVFAFRKPCSGNTRFPNENEAEFYENHEIPFSFLLETHAFWTLISKCGNHMKTNGFRVSETAFWKHTFSQWKWYRILRNCKIPFRFYWENKRFGNVNSEVRKLHGNKWFSWFSSIALASRMSGSAGSIS